MVKNMDDKTELGNKLVAELVAHLGCENQLQIETIIWNALYDIDIQKKCNALSTNIENPNEWYMKRFIALKMLKGLSRKSLLHYAADIRHFFSYITKSVPDVDHNDIRFFLAKKASEGCSQTTLNNYIRSLSSFFTTLETEEMIQNNPTKRIQPIKEPKKIKKPFTDEEVERLRDAFSGDLRESAILEVFLSTGCRVGEVVTMDRKNLDGNKIVVTGKGNKQRVVFLNAKAKYALNKYLKSRNDDLDALFVGKRHNSKKTFDRLQGGQIENIFREKGREVGIEKCHPHRFRRTAATTALKNGMPIEQVSLMLGHENLSTTQIYARSDISDVEAAHKKFVR